MVLIIIQDLVLYGLENPMLLGSKITPCPVFSLKGHRVFYLRGIYVVCYHFNNHFNQQIACVFEEFSLFVVSIFLVYESFLNVTKPAVIAILFGSMANYAEMDTL